MELLCVNPIGIVEFPDAYEASPRSLPVALRLVAAGLLIAFTGVGIVTTMATLGTYCLTSYAAMPTAAPNLKEREVRVAGSPYHRIPDLQ